MWFREVFAYVYATFAIAMITSVCIVVLSAFAAWQLWYGTVGKLNALVQMVDRTHELAKATVSDERLHQQIHRTHHSSGDPGGSGG